MECYLCGGHSFKERQGSVRDKENLKILECQNCGLVFLSSFSHIDEVFYEESGMHGEKIIPIEEWLKETEKDDERRFHFFKSKLINRKLLDFGCGVGGFLLKTKGYTQLSEGIELETRLQNHFRKNELKVWTSIEEIGKNDKKYDIITAFHVLEHLKNPIETIKKLSHLLEVNGELIIEVPSSNDALLTLYKSDAFSHFTYWSNHLFLFNNSTLESLIRNSELKLNWIKQIQRYPLSNHLYWLSQGKPGGHIQWSFLDNEQINLDYESVLASLGLCDTILASVSKESQ